MVGNPPQGQRGHQSGLVPKDASSESDEMVVPSHSEIEKLIESPADRGQGLVLLA